MTRNNPISFLALILSLSMALALDSCKSSKNIAGSAGLPEYNSSSSSSSSAVNDRDQRVAALFDSYGQWNDLSLSVRCRLKAPKKLTVSGKATMIRGKEISVSLRMLGFEVAGLYADTDSIYVWEKMNRTMLVAPLSRLTEVSGVSLSDIQDILLGRICYPGHDRPSLKAFDVTAFEDNIVLKPKGRKAVDWSYTLSDTPVMQLLYVDVDAAGRAEAMCTYSDPVTSPAGPVSPDADLSVSTAKHRLEAAFEWNFDNAVWNSGRSPRPTFPTNYRRISYQALVKSIAGF